MRLSAHRPGEELILLGKSGFVRRKKTAFGSVLEIYFQGSRERKKEKEAKT